MPIIVNPTSPVVASGTIQEVIDEARVILQDADADRFSDADLLTICNMALSEAYGLRPDLFFERYGVAWVDYELADDFPLGPRYRPVISNYIVSRAELREADHVDNGRVAALANAFKGALVQP
jgi:hypothetical protein